MTQEEWFNLKAGDKIRSKALNFEGVPVICKIIQKRDKTLIWENENLWEPDDILLSGQIFHTRFPPWAEGFDIIVTIEGFEV